MATINFGNILGNKVIGISSGIDSTAIIKELSAVRQKPIDDINTQLTKNQTKVTEYGKLSTILTDLKNTLNYLRNPSGLTNKFSNIFNYRTSTLASSTITPSSYLSVVADPNSQVGNSVIQIGNLAKALEQKSAAFNSRNIDATTVATGAHFNTGTFQIGSGLVESVTGRTLSGFALVSSDYSVDGAGTGILTADGIHDITVTGGSGGQTGLQGKIASISSTYDTIGDTVTLTTSINGVTYTSNAITANTSINAGANTGIASGETITFTAGAGGVNETSFSLETDQDVIIDDLQANANIFADNLEVGIADQSIYQSRRIQNFSNPNVKAPLTGLTSSNIRFVSNSFNKTTGEFGEIKGFNVKASTGSDGAISVDINGETYRATGLGTTVNSNLVLQSTTTDKQLLVNLGDAGVSVNISSDANATSLERALDYSFGTRELTSITVNAGDSLNDVIFAINQQGLNTGVSASAIQVSEFDYRFSLKANNEGIDNKYELFDSSNVLTDVGLNATSEAEDAILSIDGVEVKRSSNTISDVIENVTLNLAQVTNDYGLVTADEINLTIDQDTDTVADRVVAFLDAYNAFRVYESEQNQRNETTSEYLETSILGGDTVLRTIATQVANEIIGVVAGTTDSNFDSLSDIGILLQDFEGTGDTVSTPNILVYDETLLKQRLAANFDKVREIFEFKYTSSDASLGIFKTSNAYTISDFKLDIDTTRSVGQQIKLLNTDGSDYLEDGLNVYLDYNGGLITGKINTAVSGLQFVYSGDGSDVITVSVRQGIADRMYNIMDDYTKDAGLLDDAVTAIGEQNSDYDTQILTLQDRLSDFISRLQRQFGVLEQAVNSANSLLALLDAQDKARQQG